MSTMPTGALPPGPWVEPDLFAPHTLTGRNHPETSHYAARLALPRTGTQRHDVLRTIAKAGPGGLTDDEISNVTGLRYNTFGPRRRELVDGGWVEDSGIRRPGDRGAPQIVWRLTQRGHDAWLR